MVSIVIAAHNEGSHLRRTVEIILANTRDPEFELVLLDDGCVDGSFAFLDEEPFRGDGRLRRHRFDESVGCISARHQGALLARGDVLAFLDAHIAVPPDWLEVLVESMRRCDNAVITPDVSPLVESTWSTAGSTEHVVFLDDKLDFVWRPASEVDPNGFVPTVLGCCTVISRELYFRVGGFDLGLRRWGCEFIDLGLKVYAVGGVCHYNPAVLVGHLFRTAFPYSMSYRELNYNKLRTCYVHFPDASFRRLLSQLVTAPEIVEAMVDFRHAQLELDRLRQAQLAVNCRGAQWFVDRFLPGLV